jgi:hypothetical protein
MMMETPGAGTFISVEGPVFWIPWGIENVPHVPTVNTSSPPSKIVRNSEGIWVFHVNRRFYTPPSNLDIPDADVPVDTRSAGLLDPA